MLLCAEFPAGDMLDLLRGLDMLNLRVAHKYQGKWTDQALLFYQFLLNEVPFLLGGATMNVMSTAAPKQQ